MLVLLTLIAGLAGLSLGAFLQNSLSNKTIMHKRSKNVYLLPEIKKR